MVDKIFIQNFDWQNHCVLVSIKQKDLLEFMMELQKYDAIYNRIWYFIGVKHGITYFTSHNYARSKSHWHDFFPLEKKLSLHNVIILFKSVFNKDQNYHYYNILLEIYLYQLSKNNNNK